MGDIIKEHNIGEDVCVGSRFKHLTVTQIIHLQNGGRVICSCDCGCERSDLQYKLSDFKRHRHSSCGRVRHTTKHGLSRTKIYHIWDNMNCRCYTPSSKNYPKYGAKGITVCDDWNRRNVNGFINFYKWSMSNGYTEGLTIDRIDETKGYYPENCKWTTYEEQNSHLGMNRNNKTGYTGVCYYSTTNRYVVVISINNKSKYVGSFLTLKDAVLARNKFIDDNNLPHRKQEYKEEDTIQNDFGGNKR